MYNTDTTSISYAFSHRIHLLPTTTTTTTITTTSLPAVSLLIIVLAVVAQLLAFFTEILWMGFVILSTVLPLRKHMRSNV